MILTARSRSFCLASLFALQRYASPTMVLDVTIKKLIREVRSEELKNEGKNESAAHLLRHLLDLVAKVKSEAGEDTKVKKEVE